MAEPQYSDLPPGAQVVGYSDLPPGAKVVPPLAPAPPTPPAPTSSVSIPPSGAGQWLRDLESDVRYGGISTLPGRILKAMGAQGVNVGAQTGAADYIASPVLGPIKTAQGIAEGSPLRVASGALQTATLPLSFVGPEAIEAAGPSATVARAGKALREFTQANAAKPINVSSAADVALQGHELASAGGQLPKVFRNFLQRVSDPAGQPVTVEEARRFVSNASRMSVDEMSRMTDPMRRLMGQFAGELHGAIGEASGDAQTYYNALKAYSRAKGYSSTMEGLQKFLAGKAATAATAAAAGAGGYAGYKWIHK